MWAFGAGVRALDNNVRQESGKLSEQPTSSPVPENLGSEEELHSESALGFIKEAIAITAEMNPQQTDGTWLEDLTEQVSPYIKEWDIETCDLWSEWPDRERHFPGTTALDVGIDAVATRRSDGKHIAIQCKSRQLDNEGKGGSIAKSETDKFVAASSSEFWVERWVVTNGNNQLTDNTVQQVSMSGKPLKQVNITIDLITQRDTFVDDECPHCQPNIDKEPRIQTK